MTKRVLIFDDDAAQGRLVSRVATMSGLEPIAVTTAAEFEHSLQNDSPDVIVLDLQLGATDGVQQLRLLASIQYAGVVILVSGHGARVLTTVQAVGQSLGLKVATVLEKPLRIADMDSTFTKLLNSGSAMTADMISAAIANDEMTLEFQPVVRRHPKTLVKLEALIRWESPDNGLIEPDIFLPIAETDARVIDALMDWVIESTVDSYQVLRELGIRVPIAVNVGARNMHDLTLPERVARRLQAGEMPAEHLCLETTETAAFKDGTPMMDILSRLRLKGVQLSINNFGAGYMCLRLLRQMPFSEIKVDRSFVTSITTSLDSRAIVKSIAGLAANMEMNCVAEGVETETAAAAIEAVGVTAMQGPYIARPMAIELIPSWLSFWTRTGAFGEQADLRVSQHMVERPSIKLPEPIKLSPRQLDVMRLLSEGRSVKDIARQLNLGVGTVKVHLSLAYSALGASNRIEAVKRAVPLLNETNET